MSVKYTTEDFLQIIGRISAAFALLDLLTTQLMYKLIDGKGIDKLKMSDKTTLGSKFFKLEKLEKKINVNSILFPEVLPQLMKIFPHAHDIADERNRYMHDQWIFDEHTIKNGEILRLKIIRKNQNNVNIFDFEEVVLRIEDLENFLEQIITMQEKVRKFTSMIPIIVYKEDFLNND